MDFLPQDYQAPKTSGNYFKFQDGENKFRILSKSILGYEDWINQKPVRYKMNEKPSAPNDPNKPIRHFWAFIVWNYVDKRIQIMHLTQSSIRDQILHLSKDQDWGSPFTYDIKVTKSGEGINTKYAVNPLPHKPIDQEIIKAFKEKPCCLDALFTGDDPFNPNLPSHTGLGIEQAVKEEKPAVKMPTHDEVNALRYTLAQCSKEYQKELHSSLINLNSTYIGLDKLPLDVFNKVKASIFKRLQDEENTQGAFI